MDAMESFKTDLELNDQAKAYLLETAKWSKFLAIVGFIFSILFIILGLFMGSFIGNMMRMTNPVAASTFSSGYMGVFMMAFYVLIGLFYLIPCYYLLKFANQAKLALASNDSNMLTSALSNHKSVYKFFGIFMIVILSIYALTIIIGIFAGGAAMFMR